MSYRSHGNVHYTPALKTDNVEVVTETGDSFNSGFISGLTQNISLQELLNQGIALHTQK